MPLARPPDQSVIQKPPQKITATQPASTTVSWMTPEPIPYGTALSATQLNATANVAGKFVYSPAAGTLLPVGSQTLSAVFTPSSSKNAPSIGSVTLQVTPAAVAVSWTTPAPISYGMALSATQLNASANVAGTFVYTPAVGTVLPAGNQSLSVAFTPSSANYAASTGSVTVQVNPAIAPPAKTDYPATTWTDPATGSVWAGRDNGKNVDWGDAESFCQNLTVNGDSGWRLPSIEELATLYDPNSSREYIYHGEGYRNTVEGQKKLNHAKSGVRLDSCCAWSGTRDGLPNAFYYSLVGGKKYSYNVQLSGLVRALCVRENVTARTSPAGAAASAPVILRHFTWKYTADTVGKQRRDWVQTSASTWDEMYESGKLTHFKLHEPAETVDGVPGITVINDENLVIFVPDIRAASFRNGRWLRMRHVEANGFVWKLLAEITEVHQPDARRAH